MSSTTKSLSVLVALALTATPPVGSAAMTTSGDGTAASARAAPPLLRFAVLGDFGTGSTIQSQVAARMCRWRESHPFDLVITTGDNIYPDGSEQYFEPNFFQPYECLLDNGVTFHSTLGNHDVVTDDGEPELAEPAFGMNGRNYVFQQSGVRFVMVDSNAIEREWLRRATRVETGDEWTIVAFHHPVYSPGQHGPTPGLRPWLPRLLRRRGVDIVFNGHDHLYAVSKPIKKIRYVVTGGGGAGLYPCYDRWFSTACRSRHHFLYVRVGTERTRIRAMPRHGEPFHAFSTKGVTTE